MSVTVQAAPQRQPVPVCRCALCMALLRLVAGVEARERERRATLRVVDGGKRP